MKSNKILVAVGDEPDLLGSYREALKAFDITTATFGSQALEILASRGPYAIVISNRTTPEMDGLEFLSKVKELYPHTTRILLTVPNEIRMGMDAVNRREIFRFLKKPFPLDVFVQSLVSGIQRYQQSLVHEESLQKTLEGSIKIMTDVLSVANPAIFGLTSQIRTYAQHLAHKLGVEDVWTLEMAASLCQIGLITLPSSTILRYHQGEPLGPEEQKAFDYPSLGADLLKQIPHMQRVRNIIRYVEKRFNGSGFPHDRVRGQSIPLGARILKILSDLVTLEFQGKTPEEALEELSKRPGWYDPELLAKTEAMIERITFGVKSEISFYSLRPGMVIAQNVETINGNILVTRGQEVTSLIRERLRSFKHRETLVEPLYIFRDPRESESGHG